MNSAKKHIPTSIPDLSGNEWKYVKDCIDSNWIPSGGSYVTKFEEKIKEYTGAKYAIATVSGTAALHVSLLVAGVETDDLVIAPNLTFVATINAIKYVGANPILVDCENDTWQIDLALLEKFLQKETTIKNGVTFHSKTNKKIAAIVPVHVLGNMNDMDKLTLLAKKYHLKVIEDATGALGSTFKGKSAGRFGEFGCFSFNGNKIVTTGGGGIIVTDNEVFAEKARSFVNQCKVSNNQYLHNEVGFNYTLPNILAAIGLAQMERIDFFINKKVEIHSFYIKNSKKGVFQAVTNDVKSNFWLTTALFENKEQIMESLSLKGIQTKQFWYPMNRQPMFEKEIYITQTDNSIEVFNKAVSLPSGVELDLEFVQKAINELEF